MKRSQEVILEKTKDAPAPTSYHNKFGFDHSYKLKDAGTRSFKEPVPRKIVPVNLYNPHSQADHEVINTPGPGQYHVPAGFVEQQVEDPLNNEEMIVYKSHTLQGGKIYSDSN